MSGVPYLVTKVSVGLDVQLVDWLSVNFFIDPPPKLLHFKNSKTKMCFMSFLATFWPPPTPLVKGIFFTPDLAWFLDRFTELIEASATQILSSYMHFPRSYGHSKVEF